MKIKDSKKKAKNNKRPINLINLSGKAIHVMQMMEIMEILRQTFAQTAIHADAFHLLSNKLSYAWF